MPTPWWSSDCVPSIMTAVAERRPVFHNEADFQHALAWAIQLRWPEARVRLETRPSPGVRLDVLVSLNDVRVAFELKYLLRNLTTTWEGEEFVLPPQAAQDVRRYDFIKDIVRLENVVPGGADVGYAIPVTNDPSYWNLSGRAHVTDSAFRIHEGRELSGVLAWAETTGAGTMSKREAALSLRGAYLATWRDFSRVEGTGYPEFRYLSVEVR